MALWFEINRNKLTNPSKKDLILRLENHIRGGIGSVMGDRYVKSNENKKVILVDATNLYRNSMSQPLPYDVIERWYGHPDLYMNKLDEILNIPDDSDIGCFYRSWLKVS